MTANCMQAVASLGDELCFRGVKGSQKVKKHNTLKGHSQRSVVYQGIRTTIDVLPASLEESCSRRSVRRPVQG